MRRRENGPPPAGSRAAGGCEKGCARNRWGDDSAPGHAAASGEERWPRRDTCAARHVSGTGEPEEALSWRATEVETGAAIAFTGDTSYNPEFVSLAADAAVIVHDAAHSTGREAAEIARAARAGRLYLIHCNRADAGKAVAEARAVFPDTCLAEAGERITV